MNVDPTAVTTDCRRAVALLLHHIDDHPSGVAAVLQDAAEDGRSVDLVLALLDLITSIAPHIESELGRQILQATIMRLAEREVAD